MDKQNGREYMVFVSEKLRRHITDLGISILEGLRDIDRMNEYYWENYTEMDEFGYENFDNQQALLGQIRSNEDTMLVRSRLLRMLDSPFFGRVDFLYPDEEEPETFYIGIGNFSETEGQVPLIFDWRAPVSSLFYDYDKGPASYLAPMGEITGEITSKWQYKIRGGRMVYELESDFKIDDEILMAELGSHGEDKLRNIIRTIQKEQNAIIRNTKDKIMVIQGAAGSGKTSIALHRIAYLLYHDRKRLTSSNVLILSPNGIFADYISQILPELGEENIREMTFDLFAYRQLKGAVSDCEERFDQIEKELAFLKREQKSRRSEKRARENAERYTYKQSREYVNRIEGFVARLEDELMEFKEVSYRRHVLTEDEILELFYERFAEVPLLSRMDAVADYFIDSIETLMDKDMEEGEAFKIRENFRSMYETTDLYVIYNQFLHIEGMHMLADVPLEKRILPYEDVYPLLYLKYRLHAYRPDPSVRHLIVDEMQDYTWIQFALLQKMFSCKMTILGDRAQTIHMQQQDVLGFLPQIFGKEIRRISLNKCYRNTTEIASYANALAKLTDLEVIERHGRPVEETGFASREDAMERILRDITDLQEEVETAAVITLNKEDASFAYTALKEGLAAEGSLTKGRPSLLHTNSTSFSKGVTVTTFYLAKGLEFECVYVLYPKLGEFPLLTGAKYIAATRAMHELHVFTYGGESQGS